MSRYDGLIIPRSYSEYINKTDAATLSQALALPGVMDAAPTENSNKAARSGGIYNAIDAVKPVDTVTLNNMQSVTSNAVSRAMSYSTEEVNTGKKWIDGKDIYRITFVDKTNAWSSSDQRIGTITNLSRVEKIIATAVSANGEAVTNYSNGGTVCQASVKMSTGEVAFYRASLSDSTSYWKTVTVEYTKTT